VRVELNGLVALIQSGVDGFDGLCAVSAKVAVGFLKKLLGVLEGPDGVVDFRVPLGPRMRVLGIGDYSTCSKQHSAGSNDSENAVSSHNLSPYLLSQQTEIHPD
jgi:hypothetical protein